MKFFFVKYTIFSVKKKNTVNFKFVNMNVFFQSIQNDDTLNASKDKLDDEEPIKKTPPFNEEGDVVDCNQAACPTGVLCKKKYR